MEKELKNEVPVVEETKEQHKKEEVVKVEPTKEQIKEQIKTEETKKSKLEQLVEEESEKIYLAKQLAKSQAQTKELQEKYESLAKEIDKIKNEKQTKSTLDIEIVDNSNITKNLDDPKIKLQELFKRTGIN